MSDYKELTAKQISDGVNSRALNAVEIAQEAVRLAKVEGKELNAFISICEQKAFEQASVLTARQSAQKPLAGVPIAVKDNISYTGYPCTCGSRILDGYLPPYDATVVTKLIQAGAVIIGKTNMDEFAMGSSNENSYYGPVKNPLRYDLVTGGSSGGSAAAVAQKIVPLALGTETGGSVRQPASFCGLFGLKPSYGAVSRYGLVALASSTDQISPFARTTVDLALLYSVICGHDEQDATSAVFDHPDYQKMLAKERKFKIGIPREYFGKGLDPEVEAVVRSAIEKLRRAGHVCVDISLPMSDQAIAVYYVVMCAEASANLARFDGVKYGLREGDSKTLAEMYADSRSRGFGNEVKRRIMLGTYALSSGYYDAYYLKANRVREMMRRQMEEAFLTVDLIISPTSPTPAFRLGERIADPLAMYLSDIYTATANLTGNPAISVPFGEVPDGRPVGVQFTAPHFEELSLFQISHTLENLR